MNDKFESTDDARTEVGNATRFQYRKLTDEEKALMEGIKTEGQRLIDRLDLLRNATPEAAREYSLGITNIEQGIMWAVKGLTK